MLTHPPSIPPQAGRTTTGGRGLRRLVAVLLTLSLLFAMSYVAVSIYLATHIMVVQHMPIDATPASTPSQYDDLDGSPA